MYLLDAIEHILGLGYAILQNEVVGECKLILFRVSFGLVDQ
jgi:hypothetical protein